MRDHISFALRPGFVHAAGAWRMTWIAPMFPNMLEDLGCFSSLNDDYQIASFMKLFGYNYIIRLWCQTPDDIISDGQAMAMKKKARCARLRAHLSHVCTFVFAEHADRCMHVHMCFAFHQTSCWLFRYLSFGWMEFARDAKHDDIISRTHSPQAMAMKKKAMAKAPFSTPHPACQ